MANKVTPFGKLIRQLRIEGEIHMKDMAKALHVSIAQLSAVEIGKRTLTDSYVKEVIKYFNKMKLNTGGLLDAADQSHKSVKIDLTGSDMASKQLVSSFARKFPTMSTAEKARFAKLLNVDETD